MPLFLYPISHLVMQVHRDLLVIKVFKEFKELKVTKVFKEHKVATRKPRSSRSTR